MKIIIEGNPIAKMRARTVNRGKFVQTYDPQYHVKLLVKSEMAQANKSILLTDLPLRVAVIFYLPYPKLTAPKLKFYKWNPEFSNKDIDNLLKFYLDCGNDILWQDDRQIVSLSAIKLFSDRPRTEIMIDEIQPKTLDKEVEKILGIYGPSELSRLVDDLWELRSHRDIWKLDTPDSHDIPEHILSRIAWLLSRMAEHHEPLLRKIVKNCPKYWESIPYEEKKHD
jgi:Holliday junction resolvase RusA-like endonuclease